MGLTLSNRGREEVGPLNHLDGDRHEALKNSSQPPDVASQLASTKRHGSDTDSLKSAGSEHLGNYGEESDVESADHSLNNSACEEETTECPPGYRSKTGSGECDEASPEYHEDQIELADQDQNEPLEENTTTPHDAASYTHEPLFSLRLSQSSVATALHAGTPDTQVRQGFARVYKDWPVRGIPINNLEDQHVKESFNVTQ